MHSSEEQPGEEPDVTMTDAGEKSPGEDPDFEEDRPAQVPPRAEVDDLEPEVRPDDMDILGIDGSDAPS